LAKSVGSRRKIAGLLRQTTRQSVARLYNNC
jgi:hypothetical protein